MKYLLTSAGLPPEVSPTLLKILTKPPSESKVCFIPTAADPEEDKWFVEKDRKRLAKELKGTGTNLEIKTYFYKQVKDINFGLYSISLNKRRVYERLIKEKSKIYNWVARQVLDGIPFDKDKNERVELIIDRSKTKPEIEEFNLYIRHQLEGRLSSKTPLDMYHWKSHETPGLQAADIFCWGIFQKYERNRVKWFEVFEDKIKFCEVYLSEK